MPAALDYLHASHKSDIASLQRLLRTGKLITTVSQLIHQLQRERGASNLWLCSQGQLFADELAARAAEADAMRQRFLHALPPVEAQPGYSRFCNLIAAALQALENLPTLRQRVVARQLRHADAMATFSQIIHTLLNLVFEAADTACEPQIARALIALFSFMQGKELAGQERATGSAGFAAGAFTPEQRARMVALIEAQEQSFATFSQFADSVALQRWQEIAQAAAGVERLRRIACTGGRADKEEALRWYHLLTERLDQMKMIEDALAATLMQRCEQAIAGAQRTAQQQIARLPGGAEQHLTLWVAGAGWLEGEKGALDSAGLAPQLGRTVLALVREQAQRLQAQADELASLRATLDERRVIDQAKAWLMQQHGYSEEQAWQTLRKSAMNQNRRIIDIAQAILAVAATLKG
ncbi:nitrate regulatory protein [[Erwinia] mediterraneensis]|uniref:nitrate regulatory protein n=1 Tax=[Erwinia] mediterraneensis TaxID=2161819 RepID=UPI001031642A|nr:nitrate regulatory protein [[Erwinia] mediterraneensis]